jgi:hypothetical protein
MAEIEKQIQTLTTQKMLEIKDTLKTIRDSMAIQRDQGIDYYKSIEEIEFNLMNEISEIRDKFDYIEKVDSFEIKVAKFNFSMKWFCSKKKGRVEYVYFD